MPTTRRYRSLRRRGTLELNEWDEDFLMNGIDFTCITGTTMEDMRRLWNRYRQSLLAKWIAAHPK
jgi:hypothetical protein